MEDDDFSHFEIQFQKPESIFFRGSFVRVWDIQPKIERQESPSILFIPGWGATPLSYKDGFRVHYAAGRRIISVAFSATTEPVTEGDIPHSLATKAATVLEILQKKNLKKIDCVGYSEGNIILQLIACTNDCRFRNLVLQAPLGLIGKESYANIFKMEFLNLLQFLHLSIHASPEKKKRIQAKRKDIVAWIREAGLLRSVIDGISPGRIDTSKVFNESQKCANRHNFAIIAAQNDQMIPFEKIAKKASNLGITHFYSIHGGHHSFEIRSDECAELTEHILQEFETNKRGGSLNL